MRISLIGAGNVGWHLANAFIQKGHTIQQVYSRDIKNAQNIADSYHAKSTCIISELESTCDVVIICTTDSAITEIVKHINFEPNLIAHTAGSVSLSALSKFKNSGVFYPLQSFTKGIELNYSKIPFCIEGSNKKAENQLFNLAKTISNSIYLLDSEHRLQCHLAAVFANNFSNHMFHAAEQILKQKNIPFDIIKPIIQETVNKIQKHSPSLAQTGPAARNDKTTISEHLKLISDPEMEKLYSFVSQNIWKLKQQNSG